MAKPRRDNANGRLRGPVHPQEEHVFLDGSKSPQKETWRVFRIMSEFVQGVETCSDIKKAVTFFGSSRLLESDPAYLTARKLAGALARHDFAIITGGGPGVMEAANRGARDAGGTSIGLNIQISHEQDPNPFLDRYYTFRYFFTRKVMLVKYSSAFVCLPGGFGTADELFEAATLIQTEKIRFFPLILIDSAYWGPLMEWVHATAVDRGTISKDELSIIHVVDEPEEALELILSHYTLKESAESWDD